MMQKKTYVAVVAIGLMAVLPVARAAIVVSAAGQSYIQNFDTLTTSTSASQIWANDSTLVGWSLFVQPVATPSAVTTYSAYNGTSTTGSFYSFGAAGVGERALGGLGSGGTYFGAPATASGAVAGWIAASFTNVSGQALNGFSLSFAGEQWRNGGNASAQSMVFEYGFGSSFAGVSAWTAPGGLFDWASIVNTSTGAAVDGNAAGKVSGRGGAVATTWNASDTLWLRWIERNDAGNDHGLAIDDVSFTAGAAVAPSPVPLPPAVALMAAGMGLMGWTSRRRRKN
ncbi:MAG: hypothetical protein ACKVOX_11035 [Rhizobacter sp.]